MYRVVNKYVLRREDDDLVQYEVGDEFDATDAELDAFGDRLEEVGEPEVMTVGEVLEAAGIDPDDYDDLRSTASEYEDVDGRQDKETLRKALAEKLR